MLKIARSLPELYLPLIKFDYQEDDYEITQPINLYREFKNKSLVLGITGSFIPSFQYKFLVEYRRYQKEVLAICGLEKIVIISVNDPYVLKTFAEEVDAEDKFVYVCDYNAECIQSLGTSLEINDLGLRTKPFRCIIQNGIINHWVCEDD
jgi:Peroxiredoxin